MELLELELELLELIAGWSSCWRCCWRWSWSCSWREMVRDEQDLYIRIRLGYIPGTELRPGLGTLNVDLGLAGSGPRETRISWDWVV